MAHLIWLPILIWLSQLFPLGELRSAVPSDIQWTDEELPVSANVVNRFEEIDLYYTGGSYHNEKFSFRLFVPSQIDKRTRYPLIVWFHGVGASGRDNVSQLAIIKPAHARFEKDGEEFPAFILAAQVPKGVPWYGSEASQADDMLTIVWEMLSRTIDDYPVDKDRVTLAGVSSGGDASWEMALRHPDVFAAMAPISSGGGDESRAPLLAGTPIWAFHHTFDDGVPIDGDRRMVAAVREAGGCVEFTEISKAGHDAWTEAFNKYELLHWLIAQRRGESRLWFYLYFANWQRIGLQFGLPMVIALACLLEMRRRRLAQSSLASSYDNARLPEFSQLIENE